MDLKKWLVTLAAVLSGALALLFLLLQGPSGGKSDADAVPTPEVTAAPSASAGLTIAGVDVDPAADSFELAGKTLSAGDCASIASLGNLTTLSLKNCNISDVHFLAGLTQLRTLILSDNAMADASPLASLSQLRTLYLDRNPVADLSVLSPLSALTTLSIQGVEIADYVLEDLQKALPGCTALEELDLSYNDLNSLAALRSLTQLRTLNITGNPALTADMVRSLQEALPACQIITDIDLSMPEPTPEPPAETPQP